MTAEHSVMCTLDKDNDLTQLQSSLGPNDVVVIALARSNPIHSIPQEVRLHKETTTE